VVGFESGVADTVDPLGGSFYVEALTDEVERRADGYLREIDRRGGAVPAIEAGYLQAEIEAAAYADALAVDDGRRVVVGVNRFVDADDEPRDVFPVDAAQQAAQADRVARLKADREPDAVASALADLDAAARGTQNLLVPMRVALERRATLGEVADVLRGVFGVYRPG
jgi:methylmalonyl-CoA mutase N-terminal domain/subunit